MLYAFIIIGFFVLAMIGPEAFGLGLLMGAVHLLHIGLGHLSAGLYLTVMLGVPLLIFLITRRSSKKGPAL